MQVQVQDLTVECMIPPVRLRRGLRSQITLGLYVAWLQDASRV